MLEISALASGSSGNCFYVSDKKNNILIDAGISCKQIEERLQIIKSSAKKVDAIFITHEHNDHIYGVDVFARRYDVPVYATRKTIDNGFLCSDEEVICEIKAGNSVDIGELEIESFSKYHDSADPVSFSIINDKKISVITDLGKVCSNVKKHVSNSDILCLESNHDKVMLENGPYPLFLKRRIKGNGGHISNKEAAETVLEYADRRLKYLILSHLSENNNTPEKAIESFDILNDKQDVNPTIEISDRYRPTKLFRV